MATPAAKTFKAKANVHLTVDLRRYPSVVAFNKAKLAEIREGDPTVQALPELFYSRVIPKDSVVVFGDEFKYNEDTLEVECYPREMFDKLSKKTTELAPEYQGLLSPEELKKALLQSPVRMCSESIDATIAHEQARHGFNPTVLVPFLVKVEE